MSIIYVENIEIELNKKNMKSIRLSVYPPYGKVKISAPLKMKDEDIRSFIVLKLAWIRKQQGKFLASGESLEGKYISGEKHYFFGKRFILDVVYILKGPSRVELNENKYIKLYVKEGSSKEQMEKVMNEWYRKELKARVPYLIQKWEEVMKVKVNAWGVKKMKTRWGSCNINAKRIWISLELAKKPLHCLEYIVVHEMTHLLEKGHGKRFVELMDKFLPDWRVIKAELNGLKTS